MNGHWSRLFWLGQFVRLNDDLEVLRKSLRHHLSHHCQRQIRLRCITSDQKLVVFQIALYSIRSRSVQLITLLLIGQKICSQRQACGCNQARPLNNMLLSQFWEDESPSTTAGVANAVDSFSRRLARIDGKVSRRLNKGVALSTKRRVFVGA